MSAQQGQLIFIILVSHRFYGSLYVSQNELVEGRSNAQIFTGTFDEARVLELKFKHLHKQQCYAQFI